MNQEVTIVKSPSYHEDGSDGDREDEYDNNEVTLEQQLQHIQQPNISPIQFDYLSPIEVSPTIVTINHVDNDDDDDDHDKEVEHRPNGPEDSPRSDLDFEDDKKIHKDEYYGFPVSPKGTQRMRAQSNIGNHRNRLDVPQQQQQQDPLVVEIPLSQLKDNDTLVVPQPIGTPSIVYATTPTIISRPDGSLQAISYSPQDDRPVIYTNQESAPTVFIMSPAEITRIEPGGPSMRSSVNMLGLPVGTERRMSTPYIPPADLELSTGLPEPLSKSKKLKKKSDKLEKELEEAIQHEEKKTDNNDEKILKKKRIKRRKKRKLHLEHKKNALGETIFKGHASWLLMRTIQTGILNCITSTSLNNINEKSDQFFASIHHVLPVVEGQPGTFDFKDYCPHAFSRLRNLFNIDAQTYQHAICKPWNEVSTPGKSGSIFFFTYDSQYVLKTIPKREAKLLRSLLPEYYEHMKRNPNSLLIRFFGLHRVKPANGRHVRFVVMKNLFYTPKVITQRFDLKGSTTGRELTPEELKKKHPTYKDLDFRRMGMKIHLGPDRKKLFMQQLGEDCKFLVKLNIMDYSLLIGVGRKRDPAPAAESVEKPVGTTANTGHSGGEEDEDGSSSGEEYTSSYSSSEDEGKDTLRASRKIRSIAQTKKYLQEQEKMQQQQQQHHHHHHHTNSQGHLGDSLNGTIRRTDSDYLKPVDEPLPPVLQNVQSPIPLMVPKISIFEHDKGGMQGINEHGDPMDEYYFMGVIDILMLYSLRKQVEHAYKSIFNRGEISAVDPVEYAARFINFIRETII
ncbi:hypothetical protein SAMD00019534_108850 [Acytostelium subglobosum LB1]|uniref:hypothetical protein n=1 Tax=Acytostelium subglobosum LB1 TaxID=1410327 RepID=UPI000644E19C|nr:hypothetical protein SAMD00019534_108850 [Acytostelium subglobosum LB1]GAM27709.1 hypothetical protein SAMD00019534_108850 [Acytostelium subglobosum LB1]|eukprot:XP_012749368.1 hypothetical protein SAMD00019534_108850 [Acytostelium subglobosum LB1]